MHRLHKALFGSIAAVLFAATVYCLIGGKPEEATIMERVKAAGGFALFGLFFLWGALREKKLEKKDEPSQSSESLRKD